ncbi:MAG: diversity-generating retroelement protein Avd [Coleofasciculaceae cyanobacterium RL_1_1]|nr:diversity-generating retroelement protein Avd [Coleofasciculaceae cyanobacterium RL_1_1]
MPDGELPIIQATYDLIKWYVPILNRLPRDHKYGLGDRIVTTLYELLETLITARSAREKRELLRACTSKLDILRYQTRLLFDFQLIDTRRYEYASQQLDNIGQQLGGWQASKQAGK